MIIPNVRASFGPREIELLLQLLEERTKRKRRNWERELAAEGLDSLLDRRVTFSTVMESRRVGAISPQLAFYVMVRHTLVDAGLDDPAIADYIAALLIEFAVHGRAYRIARHDDKTYRYIVDIVTDLEDEDSERRQFLLRAHMGNYALWLSGLFPDYVVARVHRKGAPGLEYYEELGATGFLSASQFDMADQHDLREVFRQVAFGFPLVRRALNQLSDRYFFPVPASPVDRLLRQVVDKPKIN